MIVRNEAHCILRCLSSVKPLTDFVLIVDTGSSDGTQEIIRTFLKNYQLPGKVIEEPWHDFAWNRSHALRELRKLQDIDYGLMIDADEVAVFDADLDIGKLKRNLTNDVYSITNRHLGIVNFRPQLFSNRLPFEFRGVMHEFLDCRSTFSSGTLDGLHVQSFHDSARNKNPRKYLEDAKILEAALRDETDPFLISRYTFYLAQSYRDGGEQKLALEGYLRRAEQGFWDQEVYISLYAAASLKEEIGSSFEEVLGAYLKAYDACPYRAEALHAAARYCRLHEKFHTGYMLAHHALTLKPPADALFLYRWVYDYGVLDEYAVAAYWTGQYGECASTCRKLLRRSDLPDGYRDRIQQNLDFALEKRK
jgi:glycosyltransferase involved in cell wall biosynthesis